MKRLRLWLMVFLALLIGIAAAAQWAHLHRNYAGTVYYSRSVIAWYAYGGQVTASQLEYWEDPRAEFVKTREVRDGIVSFSLLDVRRGLVYQWEQGSTHVASQAWPHEALQKFQESMRALIAGGPRGRGTLYLAHAEGRIDHVTYRGRAALHFQNGLDFSPWVMAQGLWLDARSLQLLRDDTLYTFGQTASESFTVRLRPLPSGALPAGFFTPPHYGSVLWDQLTGWLRDRARWP